jgi:hypothetical protein
LERAGVHTISEGIHSLLLSRPTKGVGPVADLLR